MYDLLIVTTSSNELLSTLPVSLLIDLHQIRFFLPQVDGGTKVDESNELSEETDTNSDVLERLAKSLSVADLRKLEVSLSLWPTFEHLRRVSQ